MILTIAYLITTFTAGFILRGLIIPLHPRYPATRRQLARAAKANRADLRRVRIDRGEPLEFEPVSIDEWDDVETHDVETHP